MIFSLACLCPENSVRHMSRIQQPLQRRKPEKEVESLRGGGFLSWIYEHRKTNKQKEKYERILFMSLTVSKFTKPVKEGCFRHTFSTAVFQLDDVVWLG